MTTTFLLPMAMGACEAMNGNVMTDAFGIVALVAITPLIAVQLMGLVYKIKQNRQNTAIAEDETDELILSEEPTETQADINVCEPDRTEEQKHE